MEESKYRFVKAKFNIIVLVCRNHFGLTIEKLIQDDLTKGTSKYPVSVRCRDIIYFLSFYYYNFSQKEISQYMQLCRASVNEGIVRVEADLFKKDVYVLIDELKAEIDAKYQKELDSRLVYKGIY